MTETPASTAPPPASPPLSRLLLHAADAVAAVRAGRPPADAIAQAPAALRPGAQAIAFHALRWLGGATVLRTLLVPKPPPPQVDALLLTALALLWPPGAPPYAPHTLVDQAVAAMRTRAAPSMGFLNAVLRRFLREENALVAAALRDPVARFQHPRWWIDRVERDWPAEAPALLAAANLHPPMTLRVNPRQGDVDAYLARLAAAGLAGEALGGQAIRLARPCPVERLPGFAVGAVSVQDAAAQRAAPLLLGAVPGASPWIASRGVRPRVLDACAAPGGKTAHLLELAELELVALDNDAARLVRVDRTLARLGLAATTVVGDAADPAGWWDGRPFDAILLDAPCSASGVVRRHPDIRWLRRPGDIAALAALQARLLDALWPLLAPGGRLLFATCSIFREEGEQVIDAFSQRRPDAGRPATPASPGHLLPLPDNPAVSPDAPAAAQDGFFYALIDKTERRA